MTYQNFEFTAFTEDDLTGGNIQCGTSFTMPGEATVCIEVSDNDSFLSGDSCHNENADDHYGQHAAIMGDNGELGNGGQIYAESYHWVYDQHGNWYVMIEIEQEGSNDDYFTFYTGGSYCVPPAGAQLTVHSECNISSNWLDYNCLDSGEKAVDPGSITGRLFVDEDCDNTENNADGGFEEGVEGATVKLLDAHGNHVATTTTDAHGTYTFGDVAPGDYKVQFFNPDGTEFVHKDVGASGEDSDADQHTGKTDTFHVSSGQHVVNIDAGVKPLTGTISGTVFCDTDCDGLQKTFAIEAGQNYTLEAENWAESGYHTVHSSAASGGAFEKLNSAGGHADACVDFHGESGVYDMKFFFQDENDGQSTIMVKVNGHLVDTITLDRDSDGGGSDHGPFSEFVIEGVQINEGDDISIWVDGDHGEWVRFDKLELEGQDRLVHETETVEKVLVHEDFDNGVSGWSDHRTFDLGNGNKALGNFGCSYYADVCKSFNLEPGLEQIEICFDFYELDSWDNEHFWVNVDGCWIDLGSFSWSADEGETSFDAGHGITVHKSAAVDVGNIGNTSSSAWFANDNKHTFTITVENPSSHFDISFDSDLNSGAHDESYAIDNFKIKTTEEVSVTEPVKEGVTIKLLDLDGNVLETTTTDADGNYAFTEVPVGDYKIMGVAPDGTEFTIQDAGNDDSIDSDVDGNGMSGTVTVTADGTADIDLGVCEKEFMECDDPNAVKVDFEGFAAGTVISTQYAGITIDAQRATNNTAENDAMVFDSANPTGGDTDLATANQGNILIVSEDNDSSDPDDAIGGTIVFDFDFPSRVYDLKVIDTEEGGTITLTLEDGSTQTFEIPSLADGDIDQVIMDVEGVTSMEVALNGSGAIDDLCYVPGEAPLGALEGRYFCDEDGDNTDNGEPGIVGATVELIDAGGNVVKTTTTGADGSYSFDDVAAGDYTVRFEDPADLAGQEGKVFVDANVGNEADDSDVEAVDGNGNGTTAPVTVVAGETTSDVDAGIKDPAGAVIRGTVFCDEDDSSTQNGAEGGVAGVTVTLSNGDTVVTDADGNYEFTGLTAGDYTVTFPTEFEGKTLVDSNVGGDDTIDSDAVDNGDGTATTGTISVGINEVSENNDAGVEDPGTASISGTVFCDEDDSSTQNGAEGGVAGVTVTLSNGDTVVTDADGNYSFTGLTAGDYTVTFPTEFEGKTLVDSNVGGDDTIDSDAVDNGDGTATTGTISLDIGEDVTDVDAGIEDPAGAVIRGTVFCDEDDSSTQNGAEGGVAGVTVTLSNGDTVVTDADGNYEFTGLTAGDYTVTFPTEFEGKTLVDSNVGGDDTIDSDAVDNGDGTATTGTISVGINEVSENNDAGVEDPGTASISGTVFCDEDDSSTQNGAEGGVAGVTVTLSNGDTVVTDADGNYSFTGLTAGDYTVTFPTEFEGKTLVDSNVGGDDTIDSDAVDNGDGTATTGTISLDIGEDVTDVDAGIEDPAGAVIRGTVFCDEDDSSTQNGAEGGVAGVTVTLSNGDTVVTDADGNYEFTGLTAGDYTVTFPTEFEGKTLVDSNVGGDDTIDSDAVDNGDGTATTGTISVGINEVSENNDAGVEDPGTASISGTVFCDEDDSSTQNGAEGGVAGVTVTLSNGDTVVTDADGNYSFTGLTAGDYTVTFPTEFEGKTLVDSNVGGDDTIDSDAVDNGDGTATTGTISLDIGEDVTDVDAGIEDPAGAVIRGTVFCDEDDSSTQNGAEGGVAGVTVTLSNGDTVVTDADGNYEFTGLTAGDYTVTFPTEFEGKTLVDSNVGGDDTIDSDAVDNGDGTATTGTISVGINEVSENNDAGVEDPGTASISGTVFCDEDDSSTQNGAEGGVAGVTVTLSNGDTVVTDADGNYSFTGLTAGDYTVTFPTEFEGKTLVDSNVGGDDTIDSDAVDNGDGTATTGTISLDIGEDVTDVDAGIEDPAGAVIRGTVFCDEDDSSTQNGAEGGVAGVTVTLSNGDTVVTDADGNYEFTGLTAGDYTVTFPTEFEGKTLVDSNVGGDDTIDSDAVDNGDGTATTGTISVGINEVSENNDAGVEDPGTASISGTVFCDEDDSSTQNGAEGGVAGVTVTLSNGDTVVTDADGNYSFTGLTAGDYTVTFPTEFEGKTLVDSNVGGDDTIDSDAVDNGDGTATTGTISLDIGEDVTDVDAGIEDPAGAVIRGTVFCDEDDSSTQNGAEGGVAGVTVTLSNGDTVVTDADGNYEFTGLTAGDYTVTFPTEFEGKTLVDSNVGGDDTIDSDAVDNGDGTATTGTISVGINEVSENNDAGIEDPGTASISGRYFCDENDNDVDDGEPGIANALVTLLDENGQPTNQTTTTDGNGNYSFTGLVAGTYAVLFAADADGKTFVAQDDPDGNGDDTNDSDVDRAGQTAPITVGTGETVTDVDAGVEDPGTAAIGDTVFFDENGNGIQDLGEEGIEDVQVELINVNGGPSQFTTTDENGNYLFDGLDAGDYQVNFEELDGFDFTQANAGGDDTIDSDADETTGTTGTISVEIGDLNLTVDAGLVAENGTPTPADDMGMGCADEDITVNVLGNDTDPDSDPLTVTAVNGVAISEGETITVDGVDITLNGGELVFNGETQFAGLDIGEEETVNYTYTVSDGTDTADATAAVTFCGDANSAESLDAALKAMGAQVTFTLDAVPDLASFIDGYTLQLEDSTYGDIPLGEYSAAYCLDQTQLIDLDVTTTANVCVLTEANAAAVAPTINVNNIDSINWLLNNDKTLEDNGDGTGDTYTDLEVQEAIWTLMNGNVQFVNSGFTNPELTDDENGVRDGAEIATLENIAEIVDMALTMGNGFEAGDGDVIGLIFDPIDPSQQDQPFIIGVNYDDIDCIC